MVESTELVVAFVRPYGSPDRRRIEGYVIYAKGAIVEEELTYQGPGLDDWIIPEVPVLSGIMVWEGVCENTGSVAFGGEYDCEWEPRLRGAWRKPTAKELWELMPGGRFTVGEGAESEQDPELDAK